VADLCLLTGCSVEPALDLLIVEMEIVSLALLDGLARESGAGIFGSNSTAFLLSFVVGNLMRFRLGTDSLL
jgi:hypothetical protein